MKRDLSHRALEQRFFRLGLVDGRSRSANWHADYQSHDNPHWSELSVLQTAHAGEILVESKIAEEHPLLIFEQIPKCKASGMDALSLGHFVEHGRTVQFNDLPGDYEQRPAYVCRISSDIVLLVDYETIHNISQSMNKPIRLRKQLTLYIVS